MNNKNEFVSEGLTQVWTWKEEIHNEVEHLPVAEAMWHIQALASQAAKKSPELRRAKLTEHIRSSI